MNDPVADEFIEFKRDYFKHFVFDDAHNVLLRGVRGLLCVDPAVSQKASADYTGFSVSKMTKDNFIYIPEAKQAKLTPDGVIDEIFRLVDIWNVDTVLIETVAAQVLFASQLRKEMIKRNKHFRIVEYKPPTTTNKETRIRALIPYYAVGQIIHRQGLNDLEAQLVEFPRNRHDDIIDSLANHVPFWKEGGAAKAQTQIKEGTLAWWEKKLPNNNSSVDKIFKGITKKSRRI